MLIHLAEDFHLDGYQILRIQDITSLRHSKADRTMTRILKAEGVLDRVGLQNTLDLASWRSALQRLKAFGENIIVECEKDDGDEFIIGVIKRVNKKSVSMRYFDATGTWEDDAASCSYGDITSVKFRCEYINVFSRYLNEK